jgi:hypothetical protein
MAAPVKKGGNGPPSPAHSRVSETSMSPEMAELARHVRRAVEGPLDRSPGRRSIGFGASAAEAAAEVREVVSAPLLRQISLGDLTPGVRYIRDDALQTVTVILAFGSPEIAVRCLREVRIASAGMEVPQSNPMCVHVVTSFSNLTHTLFKLITTFPNLAQVFDSLVEEKGQ